MTDYFAHAAYGVMLSEEHQKELEKLREKFESSIDEDECPSERRDRFRTWLSLDSDAVWLLTRLRESTDAPPEATLIYTGDEDDRPGRCHTEAGSWLLGAGMMDFPNQIRFSEQFKERATWHTWVEAS